MRPRRQLGEHSVHREASRLAQPGTGDGSAPPIPERRCSASSRRFGAALDAAVVQPSTGGRMSAGRFPASGSARSPAAVQPAAAGPLHALRPYGRQRQSNRLVAEHQSRGRIGRNRETVPTRHRGSATACRRRRLRNGKCTCPAVLPQETRQSQYTHQSRLPIHGW